MNDETALEVATKPEDVSNLPAIAQTLSVENLIAHVDLVRQVHQKVMRRGEHFGPIPGTNKDTLLKPGAELLSLTFKLAPEYEITRTDLEDGHREYEIQCRLIHRPSGEFVAMGVGSCSTMESKYRYRSASLTCPTCGKDAIIKGKEEYGGGWICYAKKGGCGAKFHDESTVITGQPRGKIDNPDIADTWNTVLKMAKKRSHTDAILTATAASDMFTQDMEDFEPAQSAPQEKPVKKSAKPTAAKERAKKAKEEVLTKAQKSWDEAIDEMDAYLHAELQEGPEQLFKALDLCNTKAKKYPAQYGDALSQMLKKYTEELEKLGGLNL